MSKSTARHRQDQRKVHRGPGQSSSRNDSGIYVGFVLLALAITGAAWLLTEGRYAGTTALGYLIAMAWLTNHYAVYAYRGRRLARWQAALARLPLRCVGYGPRRGRPLEACRGQPDAKMMIFVSIAFSVVAIVGLSYWLVPSA
jgi:hypothetical protein